MDDPRTIEAELSCRKTWYGGYLITLDCVAILLVAMPVMTALDGVYSPPYGSGVGLMGLLGILLSLFLYTIGTPFVHLFHRQIPQFFASIALRFALPCIVVIGFYEPADSNHGAVDVLPYLFAGLMGLGGAFLAMAIDWVVVARRTQRFH